MWIFDSYFKGCVELWSRDRGLKRISAAYPPSFYMHLKDPHAHWEMVQALESRFRVEECSFNSIFGTFEGYKIYASRKVAEKIETQTRYAAELHNADARQNQRQRYMAHLVSESNTFIVPIMCRSLFARMLAYTTGQHIESKNNFSFKNILHD